MFTLRDLYNATSASQKVVLYVTETPGTKPVTYTPHGNTPIKMIDVDERLYNFVVDFVQACKDMILEIHIEE